MWNVKSDFKNKDNTQKKNQNIELKYKSSNINNNNVKQ